MKKIRDIDIQSSFSSQIRLRRIPITTQSHPLSTRSRPSLYHKYKNNNFISHLFLSFPHHKHQHQKTYTIYTQPSLKQAHPIPETNHQANSTQTKHISYHPIHTNPLSHRSICLRLHTSRKASNNAHQLVSYMQCSSCRYTTMILSRPDECDGCGNTQCSYCGECSQWERISDWVCH